MNHQSPSTDLLSAADIVHRLTIAPEIEDHRHFHASLFPEPPRLAAVLIPLMHVPFPQPSWQVVFTRRTDTVADHKGQVSFPGGRADLGDDFPVGTALREAHEEIGLNPADVSILGRMESLMTISNYMVTPVVGEIPWNYSFSLQPGEVSRVFTVPLNWLAQNDHIEIRQRTINFPSANLEQTFSVAYFKEYDKEIVWGLTAEIVLRLLVKLGLH